MLAVWLELLASPDSEQATSMTIYAPDDTERRLEELAERERDAWNEYRDHICGLAGRRYEDAESDAWEALQGELLELSSERTHLTLLLGPPRS